MEKKTITDNTFDKNSLLKILEKKPNNYEALLKLGLIDVKENNFSAAKEKFKKLLKINIAKYEGHINLANIYVFEGKLLKANDILKDYINKIEENTDVINTLAINLLNTNDLIGLEKLIEKYIKKHQSYILYYLKAFIFLKSNKISESENLFKKSINLNSYFWNNYNFLLKQYEKQSRINDFRSLIIKAKKIFKNNLKLVYYEALLFFREKHYNKSLQLLINKKFENKFLFHQDDSDLAEYLNLLSRVNEKLGFYDESLSFALKRNKIVLSLKENQKYKNKVVLDTIKNYKDFFNKKNNLISSIVSQGIDHSNLVFLIGFPRSGTTLIDTILRSHSKTLVLEEEPHLLNVRHHFYKENKLEDILNISSKKRILMQEKYFSSFDFTSDKLIIDKYPLNLIELGFIKTIFPNSKIILAIRHPLDCIISCVMTSFKMNDAMVNFENIETTSFFYNECFELLFKYFKFYKINYHEVKYENVITNFNQEIGKLLIFLDLNFEKKINYFYKTAMTRDKINTPSYDQVVQPIYTSSINRYKNFHQIKNIKVNLNKWIDKFLY